MDKIYDVFTVGAGPAGLTAALYCRRAERSVIIAEKEVAGGQVTGRGSVDELYPQILTDTVSGCNMLEVNGTC